ncbi:MAG: hypothetical protein QW622_01895 [Candidatus Pacearchaeota archaeon]
MKDIFEGIIVCSKCNEKMEKSYVIREGFKLRYAYCSNCDEKLWHSGDIAEYQHFRDLKRREFKVKLRLVGNSYAVSIPREIINFVQSMRKLQDEVKLMFDEIGKLSLIFDEDETKKLKMTKTKVKIN